MKNINFKQTTRGGDTIEKFALQLIFLLKVINKVKENKLGKADAIELFCKVAGETHANIKDWLKTFSDKMHVEIRAGEITEVSGDFNGISITVDGNSTVTSIIKNYMTESEKRDKEYRNSPAYKASQLESKKYAKDLQTKTDEIMKELPKLNFKDNMKVLDWLCEISDSIDDMRIKTRNSDIVKIFNDNGFFSNVNTGDDFKEDDEDNFARYIIGQALNCMESIGPIHLVTTFTEQWKEKFNKVAA